jgi:hypothetical protein
VLGWSNATQKPMSGKKNWGTELTPPFFYLLIFLGVYYPLKHFLHLKMLKYAPKYLKIPSQVMEIVIFNKGLFQNFGACLYPIIFFCSVTLPFYPSGRNPGVKLT